MRALFMLHWARVPLTETTYEGGGGGGSGVGGLGCFCEPLLAVFCWRET